MTQRRWSYSRGSLLELCERQLFFNYFAGARRNSSNPLLREVAILRQLRALSAWVGDLIHTTVAESLKELAKGHSWSLEDLRERAAYLAERQWTFSEKKLYREVTPARAGEEFGAIFEHEYGIELPRDIFSKILTTIRTCLDNFCDIRDTLAIPQMLATATRFWIEPPTFGPEVTALSLIHI